MMPEGCMNTRKKPLDMARIAKRKNFTFRQLPSIWRARKQLLQIARNFRQLEGSWPRGLKKLVALFIP